mgnify:CR=1 FL=1
MIALIGCSKKKNLFSSRAKNLYSSFLFRKTKGLVEANPLIKDWFILSAKYGLLNKEEIIEPYDLSLASFSQQQLKQWSIKIYEKIVEKKLDNLYFYCGSKYHNKYLIELLEKNNIQYNLPFKGLSLGKRVQFLSQSKTGGLNLK